MLNPESCRLMTVVFGMTKICFMTAPVGDCKYCCPSNDAQDIQYKLFTRSNTKEPQSIPLGDIRALSRSNFNLDNPTVIYLFGFSETSTGLSTALIRDAYLSIGDHNFISVDWSRLVALPWYLTAVRNTRRMGSQLAKYVEFLTSAGVNPSNVHVIGFSLGAEAAGFAGKRLKAKGLRLGRITGLDPAFPGYGLTNTSGHLAKGDATFVDVIHTNPGLFGYPEPIGDVDFYPNHDAWVQPGCMIDELMRNNEIDFLFGCSHNRSWRLYAESVRQPQGFPSTRCKSFNKKNSACYFIIHGYMGYGARLPGFLVCETMESTKRSLLSYYARHLYAYCNGFFLNYCSKMSGKQYLNTNEKTPYARFGR